MFDYVIIVLAVHCYSEFQSRVFILIQKLSDCWVSSLSLWDGWFTWLRNKYCHFHYIPLEAYGLPCALLYGVLCLLCGYKLQETLYGCHPPLISTHRRSRRGQSLVSSARIRQSDQNALCNSFRCPSHTTSNIQVQQTTISSIIHIYRKGFFQIN